MTSRMPILVVGAALVLCSGTVPTASGSFPGDAGSNAGPRTPRVHAATSMRLLPYRVNRGSPEEIAPSLLWPADCGFAAPLPPCRPRLCRSAVSLPQRSHPAIGRQRSTR